MLSKQNSPSPKQKSTPAPQTDTGQSHVSITASQYAAHSHLACTKAISILSAIRGCDDTGNQKSANNPLETKISVKHTSR